MIDSIVTDFWRESVLGIIRGTFSPVDQQTVLNVG